MLAVVASNLAVRSTSATTSAVHPTAQSIKGQAQQGLRVQQFLWPPSE